MGVLHLPDCSADYVVPADAIAAYGRDGHVLLRAVASAEEVAAFRPVIAAAAMRYNNERRPMSERDTYGKAFIQVMNLWRHDPGVARFTLAKRFAGIAANLLGVKRVRIYHDQALFKEAGGGHTPWHQDSVYWPIDGTRCVTMWMPLIDITPDMGAMSFCSRTNTAGSLGEAVISDDSDAHFAALVAELGHPVSTPVPMAAGDATFHGGWTVHNACANTSGPLREVMTVIYFADGLTVREPENPAQQRDLDTWLPGLVPGDVAASEINPLV